MISSRAQTEKNLSQMLIDLASNKRAYDRGVYSGNYTEWSTFSELKFVEVKGTLQADIKGSYSYHQFYAKGSRNYEVVQAELEHLAAAMGIQFDAETDFHGKLIISDPASIQLVKSYIGEVRSELTQSSSSSTMSLLMANPPRPTASIMGSSTGLQELAQSENDLQDAELELIEVMKRIATMKNKISSQKLNLNPLGVITLKQGTPFPEVPAEARELMRSLNGLMDLLFNKFHVRAYGEWDVNPQQTVNLVFNNMHTITKESEEASRYLLTLDLPMDIEHGAFGQTIFKLNQSQCEAACEGLKLLADISPAIAMEIDSRPRLKC